MKYNQSKSLFHLNMNITILLLLIVMIFNVSSLKLQSSSTLTKWVTDQNRYNSFLINKKDFTSNDTSNNSSVVYLISESSNHLHTINFNAKCDINDLNFSSVASIDLCPLQGKLGSYEVLPGSNFLYILIEGCYTKELDLIWILTDGTDLLDYQNETMDKKLSFTDELKFSDGSINCSNLCEDFQCSSILKGNNIFVTPVTIIIVGVSILLVVVLSIVGVYFLRFKRKSNKVKASDKC